ncbi:SDR family NAD(P)-dependent oxidoreductase [Bacillus pacificus]
MDVLLIYLQLVEKGNIGQANYPASKAGVVGLTKTAAKEVGNFGITCNAIVQDLWIQI